MNQADPIFAMMQRAVSFHQKGQSAEAEQAYRDVLKINSQHGDALRFLGGLFLQNNRLPEAIEQLQKALAIMPGHTELLTNLGVAYYGQGRLDEAQKSYEEALRLDPRSLNAASNLANLLLVRGKQDEAIIWLKHIVQIKPDHIQTLTQLGNLLRQRGESDTACALYQRLAELQPKDANVHLNLGTLFHDLSRWEEALKYYERALALQPGFIDAMVSRAGLLMELNRPEEAKNLYTEILDHHPARHDARFGRSMALLMLGEYDEGWGQFESRFDHAPPLRAFAKKPWDGSDLKGRRLLIWGEQGFGDVLQFVRYAQLCKDKGGTLIVRCGGPLVRLLENCPFIDQVVTEITAENFDCQISMMSLPALFGTTLETIPQTIPYLFVGDEARQKWASRFAGIDKFKIGLVWAGNPRKGRIDAHITDRQRSLKLLQLKSILNFDEAIFYSLQKDEAAQDILQTGLSDKIIDYTNEISDFMDTAALIENLDLVISVDTSVAHLAGALGKPVWILSRFGGCWRWLGNRTDSPWYPTARLFAPPSPGDWQRCIANVQDALAEKLKGLS